MSITLNGTTGITTPALDTSGDVTFADNDKAIFGAGSDLQIFHDGINSYIDDAGNGDMLIRGSARILLRKAGTTENMIHAEADSYVKLFYDNAEKLATTATGIDVTGTIIASNISDGTTSVPSTYVVNGSAKAWVKFTGTGTVAIQESLNVGSITDNSTGDYTVNFTNAMTDANYSISGTATRNALNNYASFFSPWTSITASALRIQSVNFAGGLEDSLHTSVAIFR